MYQFKKQIDWQGFLGRILESVTFTSTTVGLEFSHDLSVTVLNRALLRLGGGVEEPLEPKIPSSISALVGQTVVRVARTDRQLLLSFEEGAQVVLVDDSDNYESVVVSLAGREYFV